MDKVRAFFVKAYGDPAAVGRQVGEGLREPIHDLLTRLNLPARFSSDRHRERLQVLLGNIERLAPDLVAEMEGIAEGAGVAAETIFMLNCLVELDAQSCSVVGFADAPGGPLIAKTNDLGAGDTPTYAVCVVDVPGKAQVLHVTWPGTVWGGPGVNEYGVGYGGASVATGEWNAAGIPSNMVGRLVLDRTHNVREAIETLAEAEFVCHPFNWILGDESELVGVERSVYKTAIREPQDGAVWATNHFLTPDLAELLTASPEDLQNSRARYDRLGILAAETPHTREGAWQILRSHDEPGAICRHGGDSAPATSAAMILRPRARVVWLATGRPCSAKLRPYQLQLPVRGGSGHLGIGT